MRYSCYFLIFCIPYFTARAESVDLKYAWDSGSDRQEQLFLSSVPYNVTLDGSGAPPITPTPTCQMIVQRFGSAVSNYTLCSVSNARPIHLCEECVEHYIDVKAAYNKFEDAIDGEGNVCRDFFLNLDKLQIVSEAYKYVHHLWKQANCKSCFKPGSNGSITTEPTVETKRFGMQYLKTKACFNSHAPYVNNNMTCVDCLHDYDVLTNIYVEIEESFGESVCADVVDMMNITRIVWSKKFHCGNRQSVPLFLTVAVGLMSLLPLSFYIITYFLASKQEATVLQQKRLPVNLAGGNLSPDLNEGRRRGPLGIGGMLRRGSY